MNMAQTKIVATIGPSSDIPDVLKKMVSNGLSCVRINTAHIQEGYIGQVKKMVNEVNEELGSSVGVMIDLKGPELRTGEFPSGHKEIAAGKDYKISAGDASGAEIKINYPSMFGSLRDGDQVVMSDGAVKFSVKSVSGDSATISAETSGTLRNRSRVNVPGRFLDLGVLTDRDMAFLKEGVECGAEFYALSFVQDRTNVTHLQRLLYEQNDNAYIVSKIETKSGFNNIASISEVSDYIMVARGDLGVEMPLEDVALAQKRIILESHRHGVPTIVATQMLESMVESSSPTRAEVSDVTNAILDNADAVMLSEETAIGKHPADAVGYLSRIAGYVEASHSSFQEPDEFLGNRVAYSIARASKIISKEIQANAILAFTQTGNTVKMISAVRPDVPIYAAVTRGKVGRELNLLRGVIPICMPEEFRKTTDLVDAVSFIESHNHFEKGDRIVVTSGAPYFLFGGTNDVRVMTVGSFAARGYPIGPSLQGFLTRSQNGKGDILLVSERGWDREKVASSFRGIIFTIDISNEDKDFLAGKGKTVVFNTKIVREIPEGTRISIDGGTGIINE